MVECGIMTVINRDLVGIIQSEAEEERKKELKD